MSDEVKQYCAIIKLADPNLGRAQMSGPGILALVERWSGKDFVTLGFASDASMIAYLFRSAKPLEMMRAEFDRSPSTVNGDALLIFESTSHATHLSFSAAATWLQRRPD